MNSSKGITDLANAEHISPDGTGDNIQAKRVANYVWGGFTWERMEQPGGSSGVASYQINDIEESTTSYFGYTKPDGTWMVKELTDTSVSYATVTNNGAVTTYTDAWADRATLTYGRFDEAF